MIATIGETAYLRERALVDEDDAWAEQFRQRNGWVVIPADAVRPNECDNAMRGRVEQYEILRGEPREEISAYLGAGTDGLYPVTVWTGDKIGNARRGAMWNCGRGCVLAQFSAWIGEREYTGRGQGSGMLIRFKETATSRRKRGAL